MKIWRDTVPSSSLSSSRNSNRGDCSDCDDCDDCSVREKEDNWSNYDERATNHQSGSSNYLSANDNIGIFRSKSLLHAAPIHIQPCSDDRWLVCNPVGSGEIAVLDTEAFSVFQRFSSPTTPGHVLETSRGVSATSLENAVTLLYNTGLLRDAERTID